MSDKEQTVDIAFETIKEVLRREDERFIGLTHKAYILIVASSILLPFAGIMLQSDFAEKYLLFQLAMVVSSFLLLMAIICFVWTLRIMKFEKLQYAALTEDEYLKKPPLEFKESLILSYKDILDSYKKNLEGHVVNMIKKGQLILLIAAIVLLFSVSMLLYSFFLSPSGLSIHEAIQEIYQITQ